MFLVVATSAVYLVSQVGEDHRGGIPTLQNGFVFDDLQYVSENTQLQAGFSVKTLWWALTSTYASNWHPLTWISLLLDHQLYGLNAGGYHVTNLLLHVANALLLFFLLRRMTGATWRSGAVAALFALHPLHVESVAWIAERKDVLSTFFGLIALWFYVDYAKAPRLSSYLGLTLAFTLSLMAKAMLVTLPCLLLLLDYWPLDHWGFAGQPALAGSKKKPGTAARRQPTGAARLILEKLPLFALTLASCVATFIAQQRGGAVSSLKQVPINGRITNALVAYVAYLGKMFWPAKLAILYPLQRSSLPLWQVSAAGLLLLAVSALAVVQIRRRPYLFVGWFWYLGTLVPVIGLVQVGIQAMADRYTYVPLIGIFVVLAWGTAELLTRFSVPAVVAGTGAALVLAACMVVTWIQVGCWRSERTLWQHDLSVMEDNAFVRNELGVTYLREQNMAEAEKHFIVSAHLDPNFGPAEYNLGMVQEKQGRLDEALPHYLRAVYLDPRDAEAFYHLGLVHERQGRLREASEALQQSVRLRPDDAEVLRRLGLVLVKAGQWKEAAHAFSDYVRLNPGQADAHYKLGLVLTLLARFPEAERCYRQAVTLQPALAEYEADLAYALYEQGKVDEAKPHYLAALQLDPDWPATMNRIAWVMATHPDSKQRNGALAVMHAKKLCQASGYGQPQFLDTLAASYAETGDFPRAVATARQALTAPGLSGDAKRRIQSRIQLYEKGQPFREEVSAGGS